MIENMDFLSQNVAFHLRILEVFGCPAYLLKVLVTTSTKYITTQRCFRIVYSRLWPYERAVTIISVAARDQLVPGSDATYGDSRLKIVAVS